MRNTLNESEKALMVLDNLRVGGVQRLALDEAYSLSVNGYEVEILLLEKVHNLDDMFLEVIGRKLEKYHQS